VGHHQLLIFLHLRYKGYVFYDGDHLSEKDMPKMTLEAHAMLRKKESSFFNSTEAYDRFAYKYRSPAKPYQIRWLANNQEHDYAWFIEGDMFFNVKRTICMKMML